LIASFHHDGGAAGNARLGALVRALRDQLPSSRPGAGNGWTGPKTLFAHPETVDLQAFIRRCLPEARSRWMLQGWGNLLQAGDSIGWHDHVYPGNVWSGVYYPESGGGFIEFENGRHIEAQASTLLIFPASLKHRVSAHAERISIAFNART
jgi:hypothetical protein